ncbi:MAG: shikimate dehydrogenase [Opitutales bacterium]
MHAPERETDRVRDWRDLASWRFEGTALAVLGHPIAHSVSPAMHNAALAVMAQSDTRFADWTYLKFDVPPEELPQALPALHAAGFHGLNLTIPHKVDALDLVADVEPAAAQMGAVNTLVHQADGFVGHNSDGFGLEQALRMDLHVELAGAKVVLLGAGGAARAAAVQCLRSKCAELWIGNRTPERLQGLLDLLKPVASATPVCGFDLMRPPTGLPKTAVLINATSVGLKPGDPSPMDLAGFHALTTVVYDMIYNPAETPLLHEARQRGLRGANGLSMLVWQGVRSLEIWSGATVPAEAMLTAARDALAGSR